MSEISLVEFVIYGTIGYGTFLFMISMAFRSPVSYGLDGSSQRVYLVFPGLICMMMLSMMPPDIILYETEQTETTDYMPRNETAADMDGTAILSTNSTITERYTVELQDSVWMLFHSVMALIMVLYLAFTILSLLTRI